jgi:ATP-dependent Clp protease ATP-binding subunit ClpC
MSRTVSFTIPVYQRKVGSTVELVTLGLGGATQERAAQSKPRAEELLKDALRSAVAAARPAELERFDLKRGTRLERVRIEVNLKDGKKRKVSGLCPVIVEPRNAGGGATLEVCYHPSRQGEWFPAHGTETLADSAAAYFAKAWAALDDGEIHRLWSNAKDSLTVVSFNAQTKTLLDELPERKKGVWDDLEVDPTRTSKKKAGALSLLPELGMDLTARGNTEARGLPRSPFREQLGVLLGSKRRQSVVVVGPRGSGKSTIIDQLVVDLLITGGFLTHRNLDEVAHVWRIHGKQIIAGMSRVGEWEQRCVALLDEVRGRPIVLLIPDLHLFGRIGRARDSDRALSDFFRGPVARGEIVILGESTPEQLQRLEEDDPAFAAAFARLHVEPATRAETFRMMLARARELEVESPTTAPLEIHPLAFDTIEDLTQGLYPSYALPGRAVDLLDRLGASPPGAAAKRTIGPTEVVEHLSRETGFPAALLAPDEPLSVGDVAHELERSVMGQAGAVREAADLVMRIRAGLTDPKRPYGVFLFTGPTGTGKTELAKALAGYLYGSSSRLARFDMSELSGPDAVARLIGDAWSPEGALTAAAISQPFSVVLLDEIEKAHPAVLNLLLQLFDDGRLTDAAGNTASFTQAVVVMTSNLGARQRAPVGFDEAPDALMQDVARAVREFFPPELFNRIDAVVPFRPLTPDVAVAVTRKELSKLFARPGLVERNAFVQVDRVSIEQIAHDALRAEDGARSLKRFIEDRVATLLGAEIAKTPDAAMQVLRIETRDGALSVESEPLVEAPAAAARYALEPLWTMPQAQLRERLPEALASLERLEQSERLSALSDELRHHLSEHNRGRTEHGEPIYNIEWMRITIERLRERIERLVIASQDLEHHTIEMAIAARDVAEHARQRWKSDPKPRPGRMRFDFGRAGNWWELFSCIAETYVLERALDKVTRPEQHAVFVEMLPLGGGRELLREMLVAYANARGEIDEIAWIDGAGQVAHGAGRAGFDRALMATPRGELLVLKVVGLCITDYLELETGTHVWQPSVREPELLRVRVLPARPGLTALGLVEELTEARERASRGELASDAQRPDRLLPIVRTIAFDPPPRKRAGTPLEMEDYVLGMPYSTHAQRIADVFAKLWLLRVSRLDSDGGRA